MDSGGVKGTEGAIPRGEALVEAMAEAGSMVAAAKAGQEAKARPQRKRRPPPPQRPRVVRNRT